MNETSSILDGDYISFDFTQSPLVINESGYYQFNFTCDLAKISQEYYVDYGTFVFEDFYVARPTGGACSYSSVDDRYTCNADENFSIVTRIGCEGGECGDASVWLDPVS